MKRSLFAMLISLSTGCASGVLKESDGNKVVRGLPGSVDLKLTQSARVGIVQALSGPCSSKTLEDLRFRILRGPAPVPYHGYCDPKERTITFLTKEPVGAGTLQLFLERKGNIGRYDGHPELIVELENADYASEADQSPSAAAVLGEGQTLKGSVNYSAGDQTDWIRLEGEQGSLGVTVVSTSPSPPLSPGKPLEARLFVLDPESDQPVALGPIALGKEKRLDLKGRPALIRVRAARGSGVTEYSVVRRDLQKGVSQMVDVIDVYPVSEKSSVVVLEGREDLKEGAWVSVIGVSPAGKSESLGRCAIKAASKTQASCLIDSIPKPAMVSFRARYSVGG